MRKLSEYEGEEALELWADLLDPFVDILSDKKVVHMLQARVAPILTAREIIKSHKVEVSNILLRIDPTPLNGLNIVIRLVEILNELGEDPVVQSFFELPAGAKKQRTSFGPATESTEDNPNISSDM